RGDGTAIDLEEPESKPPARQRRASKAELKTPYGRTAQARASSPLPACIVQPKEDRHVAIELGLVDRAPVGDLVPALEATGISPGLLAKVAATSREVAVPTARGEIDHEEHGVATGSDADDERRARERSPPPGVGIDVVQ